MERLPDIRSKLFDAARPKASSSEDGTSTTDFAKLLGDSVESVRGSLADADKTAAASLVGDAEPHQAMISMTKADLSFRFMVQVRNKAVDAYREIMNMNM
ncbi:MAG: flagellar hook-basal body complex protein FliE [Deltaproteobacteria bacterium]|jgi:flagellar hook-basal body complex protein FliE